MTSRATLEAIRFGFGLPLPVGAPVGPDAMLAALRGPDTAAARFPAPTVASTEPLLRDFVEARRLSKQDPAQSEAPRLVRARIMAHAQTGIYATFNRALASPDGLRERLVRFWADHFTALPRGAQHRATPLALVDDAIRPHVAGRFSDMLRAVTLHPGMLLYLDQARSMGPGSAAGSKRRRGLNENLARELIELHTLGISGAYSQTDVRELAELLTGAGVDELGRFRFQPSWAEPGAETVLGQRYAGEGVAPIEAVLDDLARRPETATHLARKLAVHFVSDDPDAGLVAHLEQVFTRSEGDLYAVTQALLEHPAAWQPLGAKARQPFEFLVAALRGLDIGPEDVAAFDTGRLRRILLEPMKDMGQQWLFPRGPDGWPEAASAWITSPGLAARLAWGLQMPARLRPKLPDPVEFARHALADAADPRLLWAAERAENLRDGVALVLASPAFNRR